MQKELPRKVQVAHAFRCSLIVQQVILLCTFWGTHGRHVENLEASTTVVVSNIKASNITNVPVYLSSLSYLSKVEAPTFLKCGVLS